MTKLDDIQSIDWTKLLRACRAVTGFAWQSCGAVALAILLGHGVRGCTIPPPTPPAPINADISLPAEVVAQPGVPADISAVTKGTVVKWFVPDGVHVRPGKSPLDAWLVAPLPGRYRVLAWPCTERGPTEAATSWLVVGATPPVPPGPPDPGPAPVPISGFCAILVHESSTGMTKEQQAVYYSPKVADYLNRKATDGAKGWHRWDKDVDVKYTSETWKAIWTIVKPKLGTMPQLVIIAGTKAEIFPLPTNDADALALLRKYGGE